MTKFEDLGKKVGNALNAGIGKSDQCEQLALREALGDFKGRVFSDASANVAGQLLGFYKSDYYKNEVKEKLRNTVDLQLTGQLDDSITNGVDSSGKGAIGYSKNSRSDKRSQGGQLIKADGLTNPELAKFINDKYGDTIFLNSSEADKVFNRFADCLIASVNTEIGKEF